MLDTNTMLMDKFIDAIDWERLSHSATFSEEDNYEVVQQIDEDDFDWACGATKLVLIPKNTQEHYVIKIPFTKLYDDDAYDEENDEYGNFVDLECAPFDFGFDYCRAEVEIVHLANEENVAEFFPITEMYQDIPFPVYVQEKCIVQYEFSSKTHRTLEEIQQKTDTLTKDASYEQVGWLHTFNRNWLLDVVEWYGEKKLFELFDFLTRYKLDDFHGANYGYAEGDHRPVLIDFSGFYEGY